VFGKSIPLFKLFGFPIKLDPSWFIVAILLIWSLSSFFFPETYSGLGAAAYWWMGITAAFGLFASIVLHEIGHSVVARHYGIPIKGITLFIFGGVAELQDEPSSAKAEFLVAIAGPLVSVVLALLFFGLATLAQALGGVMGVVGVLSYLGSINTIVVIFNMIPAFPLDGGRVLRAGLWKAWGSLRKATRLTSQIGAGFGFFFIGLGILSFFTVSLVSGLWLVLIGLFLRTAAGMSYQQLLVRQALEGESIHRFMTTDPVTVTPNMSVHDMIENYVYRYYYKLFPVVEGEKLVGCVTLDRLKELSPEERSSRTVGDVAEACSEKNTIRSDADAMEALSRMSKEHSRMMVVDDDRLQGIIALRDLMRFFSLKIELGEETSAQQPDSKGKERAAQSASVPHGQHEQQAGSSGS
jgi:Zn-dependent protease